jgi:hypothetical protein
VCVCVCVCLCVSVCVCVCVCVCVSNRQPCNANGALLLRLLQRFHVTLLNTHAPVGPTYWSGSQSGVTSRVDYLGCSLSMFESGIMSSPYIDHARGRRLQLVKCRRCVDHKPLCCRYPMRNLAYVGYEPLVKVQYDYDKLMRCLLRGENRGAFIRRLNIVLQGTDDAWQRICRSSDPTVQLELIMRSIRIAGAMFVKDAQDPDAEITHLRRLMKHQLIHRRRLRQWFVGTADTFSVLPDSFNQYISFPMRHGLHQSTASPSPRPSPTPLLPIFTQHHALIEELRGQS